jgi:hypothetical protein
VKLEHLLEEIYGCAVNAGEPALLKRDASSRSYHRLRVEGAEPPSLVVMEMGGDPLKSDEITGEGVSREIPFLNLQRFLAAGDMPVPLIYAYDREENLIALEDLGDQTLEKILLGISPDRWAAWYDRALELMVAFQRLGDHPDPTCLAFGRAFDYEVLRWELDHFTEWGLEARGVEPTPAQREVLSRHFDALARELAEARRILVHRDFQSRNLMVQGDRLRLIDFQDALQGPRAYDLVCLLCDSYIDVSDELQRRSLASYARLTGLTPDEAAALEHQFQVQTVQRKLKDAGRFIFIDKVKGNDTFLPYFEPSLVYVRRALGYLEGLNELAEVLDELIPPGQVAYPFQ